MLKWVGGLACGFPGSASIGLMGLLSTFGCCCPGIFVEVHGNSSYPWSEGIFESMRNVNEWTRVTSV